MTLGSSRDYRYDPLYRAIKVTEMTRTVEGAYRALFDRLKAISNLGLIPEFLEMAKYPKYEHHHGTLHQVECLIDCCRADERIPEKYCDPLRLSAVFLHTGHLPFTISTERALLLASHMGTDVTEDGPRAYVRQRVEPVARTLWSNNEGQERIFNKVFSLEGYELFYRYLSAYELLNSWSQLKRQMKLDEDDLTVAVKNLLDEQNDGYFYLQLADMADYVQRDALYFGTARLDISPTHLYGSGTTQHLPDSQLVTEHTLLASSREYLRGRFYESDEIRCASRLYEKIVASLMLSRNFQFDWLKEDDVSFRMIICDNRLPRSMKPAGLPPKWTRRAKDLLGGNTGFSILFRLPYIPFSKEYDCVDFEYVLIGKKKSKRGLLSYPYETGVLLDVDYSSGVGLPIPATHRWFSIGLYNSRERSLAHIMRIVGRLSCYWSLEGVKEMRPSDVDLIMEGFGKHLSWTGHCRLNNSGVTVAVGDAIGRIDIGRAARSSPFVVRLLRALRSVKAYEPLWANFYNHMWLSFFDGFSWDHNEPSAEVRSEFARTALALPPRLLNYSDVRSHLERLREMLRTMLIEGSCGDDRKGDYFEAMCVIDVLLQDDAQDRLVLNGMIVVDPTLPKRERDVHEFDIIDLKLSSTGGAECWVYACSIADKYIQENHDQLFRLAAHIHYLYPELAVRTRYMVPENKDRGSWEPKAEETGISWN